MDAVLKKEKERIIQREIFKKKYKLFSSLVCLQNRRVFANFKNSFYKKIFTKIYIKSLIYIMF